MIKAIKVLERKKVEQAKVKKPRKPRSDKGVKRKIQAQKKDSLPVVTDSDQKLMVLTERVRDLELAIQKLYETHRTLQLIISNQTSVLLDKVVAPITELSEKSHTHWWK